jgi:hypothetical protein
MDYEGVVIEESLETPSVLESVEILSTSIEPVTERHQTPWLRQWTLHTVRIAEGRAQSVAEAISQSIERQHANSWYADFRNEALHYVVFSDRIFLIDRRIHAQYREAQDYGISRGLPAYQADFVALIDD